MIGTLVSLAGDGYTHFSDDAAFDPVTAQDFRLFVEGIFGTGKSNTLAILPEGPAEVLIPTLMIERLGAMMSGARR